MTKEWYRNKTWDTEIEAEFEARLKRCRGTFSKAQNLKIQGLELLDTSYNTTRTVGVNLLLRLAEEYQMEEMQVANGHEALGEFFLETAEYEKAEYHFRIVLDYYKRKTRNGTSWTADLKLAETILKSNQVDKFNEAYKYVIKFPKKEFGFNSQRFEYAELGALLCDKIGKKEEAQKFAIQALELSKITTPDFLRHKTLGLVKVTDQQIKTLKNIAS